MTEWRRYERVFTVRACRKGWRGAIDAVVAALTGARRLTVRTEVRVSVQSTGRVDITLFQCQDDCEVGK